MANRNTRVSRSTVEKLHAAKLAAAPENKEAAAKEHAEALIAQQMEEGKEDAGKVPASALAPEAGSEVIAELPELVPDVANPEGVPPQETVAAPKAGPVLHVKQGLSLRGGRGEWYKLLCKYDGKPVADYLAEGKANPASHYTARSVKCGQPKTPESRLSWFKRAGIVTITD